MRISRILIFRVLVIVAAGLLLTSWFLPWWSCTLDTMPGIEDALVIHPYGLDAHQVSGLFHLMPEEGAEAEMPVWFTPVMWLYLGLCILGLLFAAWKMNKSIRLMGRNFNLSKLLIGIVGFSYIIIVVLAVIVAATRMAEFNMSFIGYSFVSFYWVVETGTNATLRFGYWLACGVGPLLIVLALLRNRIIGRPKLISQ